MQERTQQVPAAGEADDEKPETTGSFQGGSEGSSSVPAGRAESARAQHQPPTPAKGAVRTPPRSCRAGQGGRTRGQSQRQEGGPVVHQVSTDEETADALLAAAYEWSTNPGSILNRTSWRTEDEVVLMAGRPALKNIGGLSVCMPSGFPEDVELPPQSVADVERSRYKAAWHEAMQIELIVTKRPVHMKLRHFHEGGNL